jgi:hypothetical protein
MMSPESWPSHPDKISSWKEFTTFSPVLTPIDESQLPNFAEWVYWNGFRLGNAWHPSFDFALYRQRDGKLAKN